MRYEKSCIIAALLAKLVCHPLSCQSEEFVLPTHAQNDVIGELRYTTAWRGDSLLDIARALDIGHDQIILANPKLNRWIPRVGAEVVIPSLYVLPNTERKGIILNLAELRIYYYPPGKGIVHTYPVSIGNYDWRTPLGKTKVIAKEVDPAWYPPKSIRAEHAEEGEELPEKIPGGDPDNPLGHFALKLGIPGYLIHGTDLRRSFGIGMRVSHGCIRLYPEDIEKLYALVSVGTPVHIIDQPIKIGWRADELFLEIHHPLIDDEDEVVEGPSLSDIEKVLTPLLDQGIEINTEEVEAALRLGDGIPVVIAQRQMERPERDLLQESE